MAKFFGKIGFANTEETSPGVWVGVAERPYYGDVLSRGMNVMSTEQVNKDISIINRISIIADPYAYENFSAMRYIKFMNATWSINSVDVQYPRLILNIGGIYNGETL